MRWRGRPRRWVAIIMALGSAALFYGGSLLASGIVLSDAPVNGESSIPSQSQVTAEDCTAFNLLGCAPGPVGAVCSFAESYPASLIILQPFGAACLLDLEEKIGEVNLANTAVATENLGLTTYDFLNQTASMAANINATFQELLSYYESRAEAVVPYFLNQTWNATTEDQLLISSGLVPSLEGLEFAIGEQEFQDWNATAAEWNAAFGSSGSLNPATAAVAYGHIRPHTPLFTFATDGTSIGVTPAWEYWAPEGTYPMYVNLMPGGTLIDANFFNDSLGSAAFASYRAYDLTSGTSFTVPFVNFTTWTSQTMPLITNTEHVSQFDLLKLVCVANCTEQPEVEALGGYAMQDYVPYTPSSGFLNTMIPQLFLKPEVVNATLYPVPSPDQEVCFTDSSINSTYGPCTTAIIPTGGNATMLSSGPGQVIGGNGTVYGFAKTAQQLVNDTGTMAYDYWLTLRAITDKGAYSIPADCAIPPPSTAFPVATNFQNYNLSANNVEDVYLGYLAAIYSAHGASSTNVLGFCNDPNLGLAFNWTGSWDVALNITASVYVANETVPLFLNGTADPSATYSNPASWPVYNVGPSLLYPAEYQMNVPLNTVYPVPINDPLVGILVNFTGNLYYGQSPFAPKWGVPTYVSLGGNGNYIFVSGALSSVGSGRGADSTGDAIDIKSCVLNGVAQNPCELSVTYFNNFTIGLVHAVEAPVLLTIPPGGLGSLGSTCGFNSLNQFYDGWAGYIGSVVAGAFSFVGNAAAGVPVIGGGLAFVLDGLGCIVAWIVVILIFALFVYVAVWVGISIYKGFRGEVRHAKSENVH